MNVLWHVTIDSTLLLLTDDVEFDDSLELLFTVIPLNAIEDEFSFFWWLLFGTELSVDLAPSEMFVEFALLSVAPGR